MATKKSKKFQASAFEDPTVTEPVAIVETDGNPILYCNDVEDLYAKKIELAGLNMPMLLQDILHELMLLRQDLRR